MNNNVLIDSSCWIKFIRNNPVEVADRVEELIENNSASICGIIELEVLSGAHNSKQRDLIVRNFSILNYYNIEREDYISAAKLISDNRKIGTSFSQNDALIAQICIKHNLKLYTLDKDFSRIHGLDLL